MPADERWAAFESERRALAPPMHDPTAIHPSVCSGVRVRREYNAFDAINSRAWDHFHATPPTQVSSDHLRERGRPVFMDMMPIASRTDTNTYRTQLSYMPDPVRTATTVRDLGVAPPATAPVPPPATFSENLYTQRLDAGGADARNMMRELRCAVVEDNRERTTDADRSLAQRQFYDRWLPPKVAASASALQAYELLKPARWDVGLGK